MWTVENFTADQMFSNDVCFVGIEITYVAIP